MARLSDHVIRDAEHAGRAETVLILGQYGRRIGEMTKAYIQEAVEQAVLKGDPINGIEIGREAARRAAFPYFGGLAGETYIEVEDSGPDRSLAA